VFRELAKRGLREAILGAREPFEADLRFDPGALVRAEAREADLWGTLVGEQRRVGRAAYEAMAARAPSVRPKPVRLTFEAGVEPYPARPRKTRGRRAAQSSRTRQK
jgi:hypothetical protein